MNNDHYLTEQEEETYRAELSRLRRGIMECDDAELERRHKRIDEIKRICESTWRARANHIQSRAMERMGY